jgi:hypothetical protein
MSDALAAPTAIRLSTPEIELALAETRAVRSAAAADGYRRELRDL